MKIKNVEELANVLGMAFRTYSATVATGRNIEPFLPLIDGQDSVTVFIMLSNSGEISIRSPIVEPLVVTTKTEVPVETTVVYDEVISEPVLEAETVEEVEQVEEKPKRKRRTI